MSEIGLDAVYEKRRNNYRFRIGDRVRIIAKWVDFFPWYGETGIVVRNSGDYLGIRVKLDRPREFTDGSVQNDFGFNWKDLEHLENNEQNTDWRALAEQAGKALALLLRQRNCCTTCDRDDFPTCAQFCDQVPLCAKDALAALKAAGVEV